MQDSVDRDQEPVVRLGLHEQQVLRDLVHRHESLPRPLVEDTQKAAIRVTGENELRLALALLRLVLPVLLLSRLLSRVLPRGRLVLGLRDVLGRILLGEAPLGVGRDRLPRPDDSVPGPGGFPWAYTSLA